MMREFMFRWSQSKQPVAAALIALLLLQEGCGYEHSNDFDHPAAAGYQWHSLYRQDIQSVAVPIFQSKDYRRGIEFGLTRSIVVAMESRTPYKVMPSERADTILEGEVVSASVTSLSRLFNQNVPQEQLMVLTLNFRWRDLRSGKVLLERKNFQQTATYYPTLGEGEFVGEQQAIERLAVSVVQEMQAEW